MIKNSNEILTQNLRNFERILMEFMKDVLELEENRNLTINIIEERMPFEEASQTLKKLIGIEVSPTQMHIISEEVGKQVFEKDSLEV